MVLALELLAGWNFCEFVIRSFMDSFPKQHIYAIMNVEAEVHNPVSNRPREKYRGPCNGYGSSSRLPVWELFAQTWVDSWVKYIEARAFFARIETLMVGTFWFRLAQLADISKG
jgi:hypothetical protein